MKPMHYTLLAAVAACSFGSAQAHSLWLEQDSQGGAALYFGHFEINLREVSPGLLDKLPGPVARKISPSGESVAVPLKKSANSYSSGPIQLAPGEALLAEELNYPLMERKVEGKAVQSLYQPFARMVGGLSAYKPQTTLDIVPSGVKRGGDPEFFIYFKGKPLTRVKVGIHTASGWSQSRTTDGEGKFNVPLPWSGPYVIQLFHRDDEPGQRGQDKYERATYSAALTFYQAQGLPPLPAAPAAKPNKAD